MSIRNKIRLQVKKALNESKFQTKFDKFMQQDWQHDLQNRFISILKPYKGLIQVDQDFNMKNHLNNLYNMLSDQIKMQVSGKFLKDLQALIK